RWERALWSAPELVGQLHRDGAAAYGPDALDGERPALGAGRRGSNGSLDAKRTAVALRGWRRRPRERAKRTADDRAPGFAVGGRRSQRRDPEWPRGPADTGQLQCQGRIRHGQRADGRGLPDDRHDQRARQRPYLDHTGERRPADSRGHDERPDDGAEESLDPDILVPQLGVCPDEFGHHADTVWILTHLE